MSSDSDSATAGFKYFNYTPSLAAACIFVIIFIVLVILHIIQMVRAKTWFMTAMIIGGVFEAIGYVFRGVASKQSPNWTLMPYIMQELFILVAPALIAATIYMFLGRIIVGLNAEPFSMIKKKWLTKIFVFGDIMSFLVQSSGGGFMSSSSASTQDMGQKIILGGLYFQTILFCFFIVIAVTFHLRIRNRSSFQILDIDVHWSQYMILLYVSSVLVLIRNIVRIAEFVQGFSGTIISHEAYIYIFDALLMALVLVSFVLRHPGRFFNAVHARLSQTPDAEIQVNLEERNGPYVSVAGAWQGK